MPVKYIATVKGGREVALVGTADFGYWTDALHVERLNPVRINERAEILLSAVALKWMGVRFCELSVAIAVHENDQPSKAGIYLASAFNTSKVFSLFERNWFHTPYRCAQVKVSTRKPWSMQLSDGNCTMLQAERHGISAAKVCDTSWEGTIYLPHRGAPAQRRLEVFFARLCGATEIAPFERERDVVQFSVSKRDPVIQSLVDSRFTGIEWRVRSNATHARSKTYDRGVLP